MKLSTAIVAGVALLGAATAASTASAAVITISEAYDYGVFGGYDQVVYQITTPIALSDLSVSGTDFGAVGAGSYLWFGADPYETGGPVDAAVFVSSGSHSASGYFANVWGDIDQQTGMVEVGTLTLAVPEPATWALMLIGFGGIGGALRVARRSKVAVAA